ncbi:MAG: hypothetical protein ACJ8AO_11110 [Gemmatimonadaceae bacterium]
MTPCPTTGPLLAHALDADDASGEVARHAAGCRACADELAHLRAAAGALRTAARRVDARDAACLDEESLAALAEREAGADAGVDAPRLAHVAECDACRHRLASLARLLDDEGVRRELERLAPRRAAGAPRRLTAVASLAGLAAAACLLLVLRASSPRDAAYRPTLREPAGLGALPPRPRSPLGAVLRADTMRWSSVPHTTVYRVTVFDGEGSVLWETQTADTAALLPGSIGLRAGETLHWRVDARVGVEDRWAESELASFTVLAPRRGGP